MSTIEELTAERDALLGKNQALLEQATQLIGDLAAAKGNRASSGTVTKDVVRRAAFDALNPYDQARLIKSGGRVVD